MIFLQLHPMNYSYEIFFESHALKIMWKIWVKCRIFRHGLCTECQTVATISANPHKSNLHYIDGDNWTATRWKHLSLISLHWKMMHLEYNLPMENIYIRSWQKTFFIWLTKQDKAFNLPHKSWKHICKVLRNATWHVFIMF